MRHYLTVLLLLAVCAVPAWTQQVAGSSRNAVVTSSRVTATVWGQVRSENTGAPLRHAQVEVIVAGVAPLVAATDSNGVYVLRDVPPGRRLMRVTHIDHAPHEVEILVAPEKSHPIDFDLEFRPVRLTAVTAEGSVRLPPALDTMAVSRPDLGPAAARVLESSPGVAELGMVEAAREAPGHAPVDPADVLYVRGGAADLKLVLLNGVPVYAPFHVGGLIHALDADVLRSATLWIGGAPARYDGGLSYVMDLETRSGRRNAAHGEVALDMMSTRGMFEGPVGERGALLSSARVVHGRGLETWDDDPFPYSYGDALTRLDIMLGGEHVLTATGFWNRERVNLDTLDGVHQTAVWGNRAGSLRYRGTVGDSDVLGTLALGRFRTTLPITGIRPLNTEGTATRVRAAVDVERPFAGGRFYWGGSVDRIDFEYRAYPQRQARDPALVTSRAHGDVAGVSGEAAFTVIQCLRLRGGLRADIFSQAPTLQFAPRLSATLLLTDRAAVTLMGGQYRQYIRTPERSLVFLGDVVPDTDTAPRLSVAEASHVVLALAQDLGEGIRLGLEGFYKEFSGLHAVESTKTEASGVDVWIRRAGGSLHGWLGYSLSWVWAVEAQQPRPVQSFSGRHLVSAGVVGPLVGNGIFDVRVSYGAGLPYTAVPEPPLSPPSFNVAAGAAAMQLSSAPDLPVLPSEPQDPYIRVDAEFARTFPASVRGFDFQVTPYLKVLNALNRRDAIFYHYNRNAARAEPLAGLPIMPVLGAEWRF
jgi:hypothetical protein